METGDDPDFERFRIHDWPTDARPARFRHITASTRPFFDFIRRAIPYVPSALLFVVVGFVSFVGLAFVLLRWLPGWLAADVPAAQETQELGNVRTATLASLAGLLAVFGAIYTARTFALSRHGQITERFTRATDQLGNNESLAVRLGGIYALQRLAHDSPGDRGSILEILTAFVRERAQGEPSTGESPQPEHWWYYWFRKPDSGWPAQKPTADIQAILTVIGRRAESAVPHEEQIDLSNADIRGANLRRAHLERAVLSAAHLEDADLGDAFLVRAYLRGASLEGSNLFAADLRAATLDEACLAHAHAQRADFSSALITEAAAVTTAASLIGANLNQAFFLDANLSGAALQDAQLKHTVLIGADLKGASFQGADLSGAALKDADLTDARFDETTTWPADFDAEAHGAVRTD